MIHLTRKMKKPFFQELVVRFPVFSNFKVSVIIATDTDSAACYLADRDYHPQPPKMIGNEAFTTSCIGAGYSIIFLPPNANMGTIAHESYHAVTALMKFIGADEDREVFAYHLGFLVEKVVEFNLKVAPKFEKRKNVSKS